MNVADSRRLARSLENLGCEPAANIDDADIIVLNTCVVRQSAEDKAIGRLSSLKSRKKQNPDLVINLMGCLVGVHGNPALQKRFPGSMCFPPRPTLSLCWIFSPIVSKPTRLTAGVSI